ncbi:MAG: T9SS type A sorting domain-containing protein [Chitinispirillaceae bacterium]|nr:T9SS type A sorting domain-containing protein [Chitinispirillaceae bacterium]
MIKRFNFKTTGITVLFVSVLQLAAQHVGRPIGFAAQSGYGVATTTGGAGGKVVVINGQADAKKLQDALDDNDDPAIIYLRGTVQLPEYPAGTGPVSDVTMRMSLVRSNKSLLGIGSDAKIIKSGLSIYSGSGEDSPQDTAVNNIIIQNITFEAAPDDGINIQGGSHHIWIDHCTFTDGPGGPIDSDGQLDYKRGSDFLTVSYCVFTNHGKMCLVGHSNKSDIAAIDKGHLRATYHYNFFNDLGGTASSRHPRVRWGVVHVLNCFIQGVEKDRNTEGVVSQCEAIVFVESNYFRFCKFGGSVSEHSSSSETDGLLEHKNNAPPDQCASSFGYLTGKSFNPASYFTYGYTPENASGLSTSVPQKAGVGKITIQMTAVSPGNKALEIHRNGHLNCFPNPFSSTLHVGPLFSNDGGITYRILDMTGRIVMSGKKKGREAGLIDASSLNAGTYIFRVTQGESSVSQVLIKTDR